MFWIFYPRNPRMVKLVYTKKQAQCIHLNTHLPSLVLVSIHQCTAYKYFLLPRNNIYCWNFFFFPWHFNIIMWYIFFLLNMIKFLFMLHHWPLMCVIVPIFPHLIDVEFDTTMQEWLHHLELLCDHLYNVLCAFLLDE